MAARKAVRSKLANIPSQTLLFHSIYSSVLQRRHVADIAAVCLQARYLAFHPVDLPTWGVLAIIGVQLLGYTIFRGANGQKDAFRKNPRHPAVAHLKSMPTKRGTKLLISGWWGTARHINYFGDWLMGLAWCLPCGLEGLKSVVPYFYCIYFGTLLVHRERRDEHACRQKYGDDWDKYCSLVRWRIIPYVY